MLVEEKELEYFKSAKKYINSNPSEYDKSLEELNKITRLIKNITIIHMKTLCLLMLSKFEDIIEFYYVNKYHLESIFNKDYNNNSNNEKEKKEIKKIISLAFYTLGMRQKAKIICPEINDNYKEEHFELNIIQNTPINNKILLVNKDILKAGYLNSNRIDKDALLKNIINNLDSNAKNNNEEEANKLENNLNTTNDLIPISTGFVDDIFNRAIENNKLKQLENIIVPENNNNVNKENKKDENKIMENKDEEGNFEEVNRSIISKSSNHTNVYKKLKEEIELNYNDIQKEDGLFVTFNEKIKDYQINNEKNIENNDNKDKEINKDKIKVEDHNKNENSNRSQKSEKQKEIKGLLNIQKIPFVKKLTSATIQVNSKLKNKNEDSNLIEKKEKIKENKEEIEEKDKEINSNVNNIQKEELKEDEKINKEKNNDNNTFIKKSFTMNNKMNFINKDIHRIYPKLNNNDKRNENQNDKANNKRISIDDVKSYNTYGFMNPIEFTLNPEEGASFKPISSASSQNEKNEEEKEKEEKEKEKEDKKNEVNENANLDDNIDINDKKGEIDNGTNTEQNINIDKNRALLRVEIDGEQIDLVHNDNPSRRNSKYGNYINIDYTEFSNQKRKKMIEKFRDSAVKNFDIKNQTQFQKTMKLNSYNLRGIKKSKEFSINEDKEQNKTITENSQTNLKKTCFYKTSYFLDKFDS